MGWWIINFLIIFLLGKCHWLLFNLLARFYLSCDSITNTVLNTQEGVHNFSCLPVGTWMQGEKLSGQVTSTDNSNAFWVSLASNSCPICFYTSIVLTFSFGLTSPGSFSAQTVTGSGTRTQANLKQGFHHASATCQLGHSGQNIFTSLHMIVSSAKCE